MTDTHTVDGITETFETDEDRSILGLKDAEFEMLFSALLDSLQIRMCPGCSPLSQAEIIARLERLLELAKHLKR